MYHSKGRCNFDLNYNLFYFLSKYILDQIVVDIPAWAGLLINIVKDLTEK